MRGHRKREELDRLLDPLREKIEFLKKTETTFFLETKLKQPEGLDHNVRAKAQVEERTPNSADMNLF